MKRLIVGALFIFSSNVAMADWRAISDAVYLDSLTVGNRAQLIVDGESMIFTFPGEPSCSAYKNSSEEPMEWPLKLNEKYVKFNGACAYGAMVYAPKTRQGASYLRQEIKSGRDIKFIPPSDREIIFVNKGLFDAIRKVREAQDAI